MSLSVTEWERLMDWAVASASTDVQGDYSPGNNLPPGSGSEGDDPMGVKFANLGPVAFVLNEALDATVTRGADRDALIEAVVQAAGEPVTAQDIEAVLAGKVRCPSRELMEAFALVTSIDAEIVLDAAVKAGCRVDPSGSPSSPPGY